MKIAGRDVQVGNRLFHSEYGLWVTVTRFDSSGSASVRVIFNDGRQHDFFIQNGGLQNGRRVLFWHEPLYLDLPSADTSKIQRVVDLLVAEFYGANTP